MVARIADFETILTASEMEALILECNLIKKHRPRYNISLRDDKTYPYVKVTLTEEFPRVYVTRKLVRDGSRYFGPYTDVGAVHESLKLLKRLFPLRSCRQMRIGQRPCLQYHIKRCLAPCSGKIAAETYGEMIKAVCLFLEGRSDAVVKTLRRHMEKAAEALEFERAAKLRDQLAAVEKTQEKQNMITSSGDQDVLGLAVSVAGACIQVFFVRGGKLSGRERFLLTNSETEEDGRVLTAFLKQYYTCATFIPREILLPCAPEEQDLLAEWLTANRGTRVAVEVPKRGVKRDLVLMAADNAATFLQEQEMRLDSDEQRIKTAVGELGEQLGMHNPPKRIECFDISHIQGAETVASMVVFVDGKPQKDDYRRYKLISTEGKSDDFRSMEEVVGRRYRDEKSPLPDLIIIDGGKGQLSSALKIIRECDITATVVGLAKEFEHIFREGETDPVILPRHSQALYLVQRIRNEAHRFAITYHRRLRSKRNMVSVLDHIGGIGAKRRQALWTHFGSIAKIKAADVEELAAVKGMNRTTAEAVVRFFKNEP